MANLASVLKDEIRRLARKEVKANVTATRQAVSRYRRDIAALKRQLAQQAKKIAQLEGRVASGGRSETATSAEAVDEGTRFSRRSVKAQRRRLGLSGAEYAKLIGVSPLTIYNWENGKTRPRAGQFAQLVAVRNIGKREAKARLAQ
jgi:DNA-binding transcriptional regulator YiaG